MEKYTEIRKRTMALKAKGVKVEFMTYPHARSSNQGSVSLPSGPYPPSLPNLYLYEGDNDEQHLEYIQECEDRLVQYYIDTEAFKHSTFTKLREEFNQN